MSARGGGLTGVGLRLTAPLDRDAIAVANGFAAGEQLTHLVSEGGATFLVQTEPAKKFGFGRGRIIGIAEQFEQAFAKCHESVPSRGAQAELSDWTDERGRLRCAR